MSPPVAVTLTVGLVAHDVGSATAWLWAALLFGIVVSPPLLYVAWLLKRGEIADFHLRVREQRVKPFLATLACAGAGCAALAIGGAPDLMLAVALAGWLQAALLYAITLRWKVSTHCAAAAALAVVAIAVAGALGMAMALAVPIVAWSRMRLNRHDLSQTVVGSALGAAATAAALLALNL
jgi:hypothetical protein